MKLATDTLLQNSKYRIIRVLGQGGFGITYEAEQVALKRIVAIKEFFMKDYCDREEGNSQVSTPTANSRILVDSFRTKFVKEAQMIASFRNPHIVSIYDVFEENGTAYYVMEFLDNGSLIDVVKRKGPLPEAEAIRLINQVGDALSYIHEKNFLHLDVKPSNILFNGDGEAVLIDFGISKHYDETGGQTSTTPVGISKGYAPIEQYQQQGNVTRFSPATDIYSLGATLFFLLTGNNPPEAAEVYEDGLPELGNSISQATKNAIIVAMAPKKKERPQNVRDFLNLLRMRESDGFQSNTTDDSFIKPKHESQFQDESTIIITKGESGAGQTETKSRQNVSPSVSNKGKKKHGRLSFMLLCVGIVFLGYFFAHIFGDNNTPSSQENTPKPQTTKTVVNNDAERKAKPETKIESVNPSRGKAQQKEEKADSSSSSPDFSLNKSSVALNEGESITLFVSGYSGNVKWESDDPSVATVNQSGTVNGIKKGKTNIWARVGNTVKLCRVQVNAPPKNTVQNSSVAASDTNKSSLISGHVVDLNGKPVVGAAILVRGTTNGAMTDAKGYYSINVTSGDVLVVSCKGYKTQSITVSTQKTIDISLSMK